MTRLRSVAFVAGDFPPEQRGVGDYAHRLARAWVRRGVPMHVITTRLEQTPPREVLDGIQVARPVRKWDFSGTAAIFREIRRLPRPACVNVQYNCLHYRRHLLVNLLPAMLRFACPGVTCVVTMHGFWEQSRLFRLRTLPMLRGAHGVIFVDRQNDALLARFAGAAVARRFIPIGSNIAVVECDAQARQRWRREAALEDHQIVVSFFGGISRSKGVDYLLEAVEQARAQTGADVVLQLVGGFQQYPGADLVYEAGLRERFDQRPWVHVHNYPPAQRVSQLLHASDIGATPMLRGVGENSGSMLATMAHGLPTIVTKGEATLPPDYPVVVVPARDSGAFASALVDLVQSEQRRRELGARAREFSRRFDWNYVAAQTELFVDSLIGHNHR